LAESHKLDPWLLDDDLRPKSGKLKLNLYGSSLEGNQFVQTKRKSSKERAHDLDNQDAHTRLLLQGMVQLKDSICFKLVQIGS